jgi:hypothetical protein
MLTATLEPTNAELNELARATLAEMGEAPPVIPPEQPAAEEDAEDEPLAPLSWISRGNWAWRGRTPAELGSDAAGCPILTLTLQTNRPPALGELGKVADDTADKARADALSLLQSTEEWGSYLEAKAEQASVKHRLDALEKEGKELESERQRLAARPKNQGRRLAEIAARQSDISKEKHAAELELQAMQPIYTDARLKAQERARVVALDTVTTIRQQQLQALDNALAEFYSRHADELTDIAARVIAKASQGHDTCVADLRMFILSRMEAANPLPEPSV